MKLRKKTFSKVGMRGKAFAEAAITTKDAAAASIHKVPALNRPLNGTALAGRRPPTVAHAWRCAKSVWTTFWSH